MTYDDVMNAVRSNPYPNWSYNDERRTFTLRDNVNITIRRKDIDFNDPTSRFSTEDWATNHPDSVAYQVVYEIYYGASFVENFVLVAVDGLRAYLPVPNANTTIVSRDNYLLAKAVGRSDALDEYLERAKLTVEQ